MLFRSQRAASASANLINGHQLAAPNARSLAQLAAADGQPAAGRRSDSAARDYDEGTLGAPLSGPNASASQLALAAALAAATEALQRQQAKRAPSDRPKRLGPRNSAGSDLHAAAGSQHEHQPHYYQYAEVPEKKAWKFGFRRGNHKHEIERHEKGHKHKFHTTFKWHAKEKCKKKSKCKSVGKMVWEYKHHKKHHHP